MAVIEELPVDEQTAQWPVWGTTARLVVTEANRVAEARAIVEAELARIDEAASVFRPDSELSRLCRDTTGRPVLVSPLLADLIDAALTAARRSHGAVDPTAGSTGQPTAASADQPTVRVGAAPCWRRVRLDGRRLTMPPGTVLDLGATAKARAADRCAAAVAADLGVGALVSLGGDIATAGPGPESGWRVLVRDRPGDPSCVIALPAGAALATSSTVSRGAYRAGRWRHHIIDPFTMQPADTVWRTATAVARHCVEANTLTTAALVRGDGGPAWLRSRGATARLVSRTREVVRFGGWPE